MKFETRELVNPSTRQLTNLQFSIIIPTYKRNDLLALCLQRLQPGAQSLEANLYEVIVTDDAADPATQHLLLTQFPWAKYTAGPQRGPAANRNRGAALATGQWLVFTDDDCLPDAHWLQAYNEAIAAHPSCRAFEGTILPDDWALLKKDMAECPVNTEGGCFWSANIMVQKKLFGEIGGFDEQFTIAAQEDQDLQWRLQQKSNIIFIKLAKVIHPVRFRKLGDSLDKINLRIKNFLYYAAKHKQTLGYKDTHDIIWKAGLKMQAISMLNNLKTGRVKAATVCFFNFLQYLLKYLQTN